MFMTRVKTRMRAVLRLDFLRRENGSVAIEAVLVLPMLFWVFLSVFSIFDAFRMYSVNQKAAFTIGDAISRETVPIDSQYLAGMQDLFEYLARADGKTSIRVSSIWYDKGRDRFIRDWSQKRGSVTALTNDDVRNWHDKLPLMLDQERVVLVETWTDYDPPFKTGLENLEIKNFVFTRPRYAPRVCWDDCN